MNGLKQKLHKLYRNNTLRYWFTTSTIYTMSSVCPFCGKQICPTNFGISAIVGGFFALGINFRAGIRFIGHLFRRNSCECGHDGCLHQDAGHDQTEPSPIPLHVPTDGASHPT